MKGVRFNMEKQPRIAVEYEREKLTDELRNKFIPRLVKYFNKKLEKGEIEDAAAPTKYIILILETSLKAEFSIKELRNIEPYSKKFAFLPYKAQFNSGSMGHAYTTDDAIHNTAFHLIALCKGYKDIVRNYVDRNIVLESRHDYRGDKYVGYDIANAISEDAAELTKKCIREFLQEIRETGRVMTSAELAEYQQTSVMSSIEERNHSEDETIITDRDSGSSSSTVGSTAPTETSTAEGATSHNQEPQQRASLDIKNEEDNNDHKEANNKIESTTKTNTLLEQILSWIYELPEWLQEQILNSSPVKALIESAEQWAAMHDKKSIADLFAKLFTVDLTSDATDATEDNINAKVTIDNSYTIDQIDMSMVLNEAIVSGWILPTAAPELNDLFIGSDSIFNELPINFNDLHRIDLF